MQGHLPRLLFTLALAIGLLASATTSASGAVAVEQASAVGPATARQALAVTDCPPPPPLNAPRVNQESAMLCLVNEARARRGLPPLHASAPLNGSAVEKGGDLIGCNEFSHTACGREFSFWIRETGYMSPACWRVGENLAWGVDKEGTVASIFSAWMHSPAHRENILGDFEEVGIDLRVARLGGLSGVHVWVQHFGSHCGS